MSAPLAALLQALALAAAPATHGRLLLSVAADGGWASDAWVGADRGAGALARVAPAARLDLSLAPRLKLAVTGDGGWTRYDGADFATTTASGAIEARVPLDVVELAARAGGDGAWYSDTAPAGDLAGAPGIRSALGADLGLACRARGDRLRGRAAAELATRTSHLPAAVDRPAADAVERGLALSAGLGWSPSPALDLDLDARHARARSANPGFARVSTAGALALSTDALPAGLEARLAGSAETLRFDSGLEELVLRAGLDLSRAVGPVTAVAGWSWTSSDPRGLATSRRQAAWVGLRAGGKALSW